MTDVKVKVRVSHLALGTIKDRIEDKVVYSKGQEFICTESEAARLGNSVIILEKIPEPEKATGKK